MDQIALLSVTPAPHRRGSPARALPVPADQSCPRVDLWRNGAPHRGSLVGEARDPFEYVVQLARPEDGPALRDAGAIGLSYWRDRSALRRLGLTPTRCRASHLDEERGLLRVQFGRAPEPAWTYELAEPIPVEIAGVPGRVSRLPAQVTSLGPYEGSFEVAGGAFAWLGGALLVLHESHLGEAGIRVQVTSRDASGRTWFRVADGASSSRAAVALLRWSAGFSPAELVSYGVPRRRSWRELRVEVAATQETMGDALRVRLIGNQAFGRLPGVTDEWSIEDPLDAHAINFVAYLGRHPVGTGRLVLNGGDRALSEIEREVGLPSWLWADGFAEVSRVAIHPACRGSGVMVALFQEVARIALSNRCRYLVMDCIEKLLPSYQRVGGKQLGIRKCHPYSGEMVHVMIIDILDGLTSLHGNLAYWTVVFGPVVRQFHELGALDHYLSGLSVAQRVSYRAKLALSRLGS